MGDTYILTEYGIVKLPKDQEENKMDKCVDCGIETGLYEMLFNNDRCDKCKEEYRKLP